VKTGEIEEEKKIAAVQILKKKKIVLNRDPI